MRSPSAAGSGIPIHFRDFSGEYWNGVFEHFLAEYAAGRTPNPDVLCNREIKFKHFLDAARELGARAHRHRPLRPRRAASAVASSCCARSTAARTRAISCTSSARRSWRRRCSRSANCSSATCAQMALEAGLPTAAKKDSTGICFIGERDFREFLGRYLPARAGEMRTPDGQRDRRAPGRVLFHPRPARRPATSAACAASSAAPWYVVGKDVAGNVLYVDQGADSPWLQSHDAVVGSRALDRRRAARGALRLHRADPLSPARRGLRGARCATTARWKCASPAPSAR